MHLANGGGLLAAFTTELRGFFPAGRSAGVTRAAKKPDAARSRFADVLMLHGRQSLRAFARATNAFVGNRHPERCTGVLLFGRRQLATVYRYFERPPKFLPGVPGTSRLRESFDPVFAALRDSLSKVLVRAPLRSYRAGRPFGITWRWPAIDLLSAARIPPRGPLRPAIRGASRRSVPDALKICPGGKSGDLVRLPLPGVRYMPLPVAPGRNSLSRVRLLSSSIKATSMWEPTQGFPAGIAMHSR